LVLKQVKINKGTPPGKNSVGRDHCFFMELALTEAGKALYADEVPVGAVLVDKNGTILASGYNQPISRHDPTAHAEISALRDAGLKTGNYRFPDTTLYVTVEPCIMCMGAIIHSRVAHVIFGTPDPKWGAAGSLYDFSADMRLNHQVRITGGVLQEQCRDLIVDFFKKKRL
jgi:tRNA(adenine34) deaminase